MKNEEEQMSSTAPQAVTAFRHYVYLYIDPRDGKPFYIGTGCDDCMHANLYDGSEADKATRIAEIRAGGKEPQVDLLRYGLTESDAWLVQASAIDLIGRRHLTNQFAGHGAGFPRVTSQEAIAASAAQQVVLRHKAILLTIDRDYRSDMTPEELYEVTRGTWRVGRKRDRVDYAMPVHMGVVREVYRIDQPWLIAGTLEYRTRPSAHSSSSKGWEFRGSVAADIREQYVGYSVGRGGQNPVRYVNV
jgi:uncharacterized protein